MMHIGLSIIRLACESFGIYLWAKCNDWGRGVELQKGKIYGRDDMLPVQCLDVISLLISCKSSPFTMFERGACGGEWERSSMMTDDWFQIHFKMYSKSAISDHR